MACEICQEKIKVSTINLVRRKSSPFRGKDGERDDQKAGNRTALRDIVEAVRGGRPGCLYLNSYCYE